MDFIQSTDYLLSLGNEVETMKLGLDNIRTLLAELGDPQTRYKKVQVAGTNGKGSVCAFLDSICSEAGIRAGLYTSPHLISITERVKIGGNDVSEREFARLATIVREASENLVRNGNLERVPTYFEQVTAIGLLAFAEAGVELAILETGLGGRYDAVTAANAEIAVITRIDLDHQEYLGDTIEEIAAEKAAIIRPDSKVILTHQSRSVEQVFVGRCREVGVDPVWATTDIRIKDEPILAPTLAGSITTEIAHYDWLEFWNMRGRHQFENAAIAIGAAEILAENGFQISQDDIVVGLDTATHPGRLEFFDRFLLDGAHNPAGARALCAFLEEFSYPPLTIIFGAMKDKDVGEILDTLLPRAARIIFTEPANTRSAKATELLSMVAEKLNGTPVYTTDSAQSAIEVAQRETPLNSVIIVTGSLYLVGEVRAILTGKHLKENN